MILRGDQIRHQKTDIGTEKVMNDGIGRLSRSLARKVATCLHLEDTPTCFQGRLGSAKGMWIIDVDNSDAANDCDWIETFPSQRKWTCSFEDIHHRTLEIRSWARELRTAALNKQFIPILEAQSKDPSIMRQSIAEHLICGLRTDLDAQTIAMNHPMDLRLWMQRAGFSSNDRESQDRVPFLGGLPDKDEATVSYLLDSGFQVDKNEYLRDLVWKMRNRQAEDRKSVV